MPRRDHRKMKKQKVTSERFDSSKAETPVSSILDDVSAAIPDMVDSIMTKIEDASLDTINSPKQSKLEKELSTIKSDVESIKFDVVEILRQLPPRERRKPDSLGDVLNSIFSGKMETTDEGITFGDIPYTRTTGNPSVYRSLPNSKWDTTISKVEEATDSDTGDISDSDTGDISDSDTGDISDSDTGDISDSDTGDSDSDCRNL